MFRIDDPTAAPAIPTPQQPGTPGYFTGGSPSTGLSPTRVSADFLNAVQEELAYVIEAASLVLSKTDRTQLFQALQRLTRTRLSAPLTLYVSPTGSDSNDGLSPATAFASISAAYNDIRDHYDLSGNLATIQVANGTYAPQVFAGAVAGPSTVLGDYSTPPVKVVGNTTTPSSVIINNSNGPAVTVGAGASIWFDSVRVTAAGTTLDYGQFAGGFVAYKGGSIFVSNIDFGPCQSGHLQAVGGYIQTPGQGTAYTISGGGGSHFAIGTGGFIAVADATITLTGTPAFADGFASAVECGIGYLWGNTFNGTATGSRFYVGTNAVINTNGGGASYFPGSAAGTNDGTGVIS